MCPITDDSEGITLRSLGGVFIATLVGLGIALIVLVFEVYANKKEAAKNEVKSSAMFLVLLVVKSLIIFGHWTAPFNPGFNFVRSIFSPKCKGSTFLKLTLTP